MPIIHEQLDPDGHALVNVLILQSAPRVQAAQSSGQLTQNVVPTRGLIDTGATLTIIDRQIRQTLNLTPFRVRRVVVPSSPTPILTFSYKICLVIQHPSGNMGDSLVLPMQSVCETSLAHTGSDVVIGCDVLAKCQFLHNGVAGTFSLSY